MFYSDDGQRWHRSHLPGTANINGMMELADGKIVALCNNAVWLQSSDGGKQFRQHKLTEATLALAGVELNHQLVVVSDKGIQQLKQ